MKDAIESEIDHIEELYGKDGLVLAIELSNKKMGENRR